MHQLVLDNIEYILIFIIAAQALILYGQSRVKDWAEQLFVSILEFMRAVNSINTQHQKSLDKIEDKLK